MNLVAPGQRAQASPPAGLQGRDTEGLPGTQNRQRFSVATLMPIRVPRPGRRGGGVPSSSRRTRPGARSAGPERRRAARRSAPLSAPVMPRAWQSLAGPLHRSRSRRAAAPGLPHLVHPGDGFEGADQHGGRLALGPADHVGAPVHAVGEVHVEEARRPEHDRRPRRQPPVGVRRRVVGPVVRLDLDDAPGPLTARQHLVQQPRSDRDGVALQVRALHGATLAHPGGAAPPARAGRGGAAAGGGGVRSASARPPGARRPASAAGTRGRRLAVGPGRPVRLARPGRHPAQQRELVDHGLGQARQVGHGRGAGVDADEERLAVALHRDVERHPVDHRARAGTPPAAPCRRSRGGSRGRARWRP